jgi:hypothetical protein
MMDLESQLQLHGDDALVPACISVSLNKALELAEFPSLTLDDTADTNGCDEGATLLSGVELLALLLRLSISPQPSSCYELSQRSKVGECGDSLTVLHGDAVALCGGWAVALTVEKVSTVMNRRRRRECPTR